MQERRGIKWNREETILAFDLYYKTPFGRISSGNPDIIKLAELLHRSAGSVALKMQNLAHFDPELQKRNIVAMSHGSKLDGLVFEEFSNNWLELAYQAQVIRAGLQQKEIGEIVDLGDIESIPLGEDRIREQKIRVGQYFFRTAVLNSYNNKCCITGLDQKELLIASHIKPWAVSDEKTERTNPWNGLCLNALHDKAFDKGFITIDKDYRVVISNVLRKSRMDEETKAWFMGYEGCQIKTSAKFKPGKEFIEYHNDVVFLH